MPATWSTWLSTRSIQKPAKHSRESGRTSGTTDRWAAANGAVNVSAASSSRSRAQTGVPSTASSASTPISAARARSQVISTTLRGSRSAAVPSSPEPNTAGTKLTTKASTARKALSVRTSTSEASATRAMLSPHSLATWATTRPRNSGLRRTAR